MKISALFALFLAVLSGIILALAFPPLNFEGLIWIGLTPVLASLLLFNLGRLFALLSGALFGLSFGGVTFFWLLQSNRAIDWFWNAGTLGMVGMIWAYLVHRFVELPIRKSVRKERLSPILPGQGWNSDAWEKSLAHLRTGLFIASAWTVLEWARGVLIPGWNTLGSALQTSLPLLQLATVTGASGLTFAIVFVNVIVFTTVRRLILEPGRMSWAGRFDATVTLGGIFLIAVGGFYFLQRRAESESRIVGLVPTLSTDVQELVGRVKEFKATTPVDLWVWHAAKIAPGDYSKFAEASIGKDSALVSGVITGDQGTVNGAVIITPKSVKNLFIVPRSYPLFQPGAGSLPRTLNSFDYKDATWVPLLNWEGGDLQLARGGMAKGIQILISISNLQNAPPAATQQMFCNMRFLTLSLGRPLIFVSPLLSAVTTKSGKLVLEQSGEGRAMSGKIEAPAPFEVTIYGRYGDWLAVACGAVTIVGAISRRLRRKASG
jgi:apolipoprotein N-acyltransferase